MTRHALLDSLDHRDLRVQPGRIVPRGEAPMTAPTFPAEFRNIQSCYPIVFQPGADGALQPVALFGFEHGDNLFVADGAWNASYLPLSIERQPFLIGRAGEELVVHIDLDDARVGGTSGQALFEHGGNSAFLERIGSVLHALHGGLQGVPPFVEALQSLSLLESFVFDVETGDGDSHRLAGFHAIAEDRLRTLDGAALERLHREGWLEAVYMAVASLSRFRDLVERRERRHAGG